MTWQVVPIIFAGVQLLPTKMIYHICYTIYYSLYNLVKVLSLEFYFCVEVVLWEASYALILYLLDDCLFFNRNLWWVWISQVSKKQINLSALWIQRSKTVNTEDKVRPLLLCKMYRVTAVCVQLSNRRETLQLVELHHLILHRWHPMCHWTRHLMLPRLHHGLHHCPAFQNQHSLLLTRDPRRGKGLTNLTLVHQAISS